MGRPAKEPKKKLVEVPCKVSPEVADLIADIADATDRPRGQITRKLVYRGLAAYMRDGSLEETESTKNILLNNPAPPEHFPAKMKASIYVGQTKKGGRK